MFGLFKNKSCIHKYEKMDWYDFEGRNHSVRLYRCIKCGKEIWLDKSLDIGADLYLRYY